MIKLVRLDPAQVIDVLYDFGQLEGLLDGYSHLIKVTVRGWPLDNQLACFNGIKVGINYFAAAGDLTEIQVKESAVDVEVRTIVPYILEPTDVRINYLPLIDTFLDRMQARWHAVPLGVKINVARKEFIAALNEEWDKLGLPWDGAAYARVRELIIHDSLFRTVNAKMIDAWAMDLTQLWL